jgi:hypothetical protein
MNITHTQVPLMKAFFEAYPHHTSLRDMLNDFRKFAAERACVKLGCSKKEARGTEEYRFDYGALGEVFTEFWLRVFGGKYYLAGIFDTSVNPWCRGFDFVAASAFSDSLLALIQVKMRSDELKAFLKDELRTLFDEAQKRGILPQHLLLIVPTSSLDADSFLSYKDDFKRDFGSKLICIGFEEMFDEIMQYDDGSSLGRERDQLEGLNQFLAEFRRVVTSS